MIKFKKGAFVNLRGVKPFSMKTNPFLPFNPNSTGTLGFVQQTVVTTFCLFYTLSVTEMPVFEPNEYFWKHHWDGKEEKWVAFARAVQNIIAKQNNLKLSDNVMEDKLVYKNLIRNKAKKD